MDWSPSIQPINVELETFNVRRRALEGFYKMWNLYKIWQRAVNSAVNTKDLRPVVTIKLQSLSQGRPQAPLEPLFEDQQVLSHFAKAEISLVSLFPNLATANSNVS